MDDARQLLSREGPLAHCLAGFAPRGEQQDMAEAVQQAIADRASLIVEAGTGVGKTFAYLVPALSHQGRVIISTGTRHLQDQLFHKDLPLVSRALGVSVEVALLKGRSNYLCPHRLKMTQMEAKGLSPTLQGQLAQALEWAEQTQSGDIAELEDIPEDSLLWPRITSTIDNCLGQECPEYDRCPVLRARRKAQDADIVVINHHLLLADMGLRESGFAELLPTADAIIIDEAHQLPELATQFFGEHLGSRQLLDLARDVTQEVLSEAPDMPELRDAGDPLSKSVRDFRLALEGLPARGPWADIGHQEVIVQAHQALHEALQQLRDQLSPIRERGRGLEACARRIEAHLAWLARFAEAQSGRVLWYETFSRSFTLHATPLDVANHFSTHRQALTPCWIFTSATLSVGGGVQHFLGRLGLQEARTLMLESPFDYPQCARLLLPAHLPEPNDPGHTAAVVQEALPLIEANPGGSFLLFTSLRALQEAAKLLRPKTQRTVLVQNEAPRQILLQRFREAGNAVLLGSQSFWEGVDVRGMALTLVVIDRLPFASPGDPVLEARMADCQAKGENPFTHLQMPQAVILLKQGAGRLIRDPGDFGVLMICDKRIKTKSYGRLFIKSLPNMPVLNDSQAAAQFLRSGGALEAAGY